MSSKRNIFSKNHLFGNLLSLSDFMRCLKNRYCFTFLLLARLRLTRSVDIGHIAQHSAGNKYFTLFVGFLMIDKWAAVDINIT
jgi:hypothetical protein